MNVVSHPQLIMTKRPTCKKRIPWRIPAVGTAFQLYAHRCAHRYTACRLGRAPRNTSAILTNFRRNYLMVSLQGCLLIFAVMSFVLDVQTALPAFIRGTYAGRPSH